MAKKKKKQDQAIVHPTIFVHDGTLKYYEEGSMLQLHTLVNDEEWAEIVEDTIQYLAYVECLKTIAFPMLSEPWTEEEEWYRVQLELAVSRIKNIDPILAATQDVEAIMAKYSAKMRRNAAETAADIERMKVAIRGPNNDTTNSTLISGL